MVRMEHVIPAVIFRQSFMENTQKTPRRRPPRFELTGDLLCLDFVNTLDNRPSSEPKELLEYYVDLARFAEDTGILAPHQADQLVERSALMPDEAQRTLRYAVELREALYAVLAALMKKQPAPAMALVRLNGFVQHAAQHARLVESGARLEWRFDDPTSSLDAPLWAIARSAADLLASDQMAFVRACSSKTCQWLFLDTSKNHRRRWCDMKLCGNRAKGQRFYRRKKSGK